MAHTTRLRVRFADLDPYDHVNHARYLTYFESARIEALAEIGFGMDGMKERGMQIVLYELQARYLVPCVLHDDLDIATSVVEILRTGSTWHQAASRRGTTVAEVDIRTVFTDRSGRPIRTPPRFAEAAARYR